MGTQSAAHNLFWFCGNFNHSREVYAASSALCFQCGKMGDFSIVCWSRPFNSNCNDCRQATLPSRGRWNKLLRSTEDEAWLARPWDEWTRGNPWNAPCNKCEPNASLLLIMEQRQFFLTVYTWKISKRREAKTATTKHGKWGHDWCPEPAICRRVYTAVPSGNRWEYGSFQRMLISQAVPTNEAHKKGLQNLVQGELGNRLLGTVPSLRDLGLETTTWCHAWRARRPNSFRKHSAWQPVVLWQHFMGADFRRAAVSRLLWNPTRIRQRLTCWAPYTCHILKMVTHSF